MEDEVLKALELLYSQGKKEEEVLSIVEEAGFGGEADKIKDFYKKKVQPKMVWLLQDWKMAIRYSTQPRPYLTLSVV